MPGESLAEDHPFQLHLRLELTLSWLCQISKYTFPPPNGPAYLTDSNLVCTGLPLSALVSSLCIAQALSGPQLLTLLCQTHLDRRSSSAPFTDTKGRSEFSIAEIPSCEVAVRSHARNRLARARLMDMC